MTGRQAAQLFLQVAVGMSPRPFHCPDRALVTDERILERSDETFHGVLAASELDLERFPSAIEEGGAALLQRLRAESLECLGQTDSRLVEEVPLLLQVYARGLPPRGGLSPPLADDRVATCVGVTNNPALPKLLRT